MFPQGASLFSGASGVALQGTDVAGNLGQLSAELWGMFSAFTGGALAAALGGAAGARMHGGRDGRNGDR